MRISSTEPSSVILTQTKKFEKFKSVATKSAKTSLTFAYFAFPL